MKENLNINVLAINVNSLNVSMMDRKNSKTFLKIEGITGKKPEVIFLTDVRAGSKGNELRKLFSLTRNGSYKVYMNSSKESRGVAIAAKRNIFHEKTETITDGVDEKYIFLKMKYKSTVVT